MYHDWENKSLIYLPGVLKEIRMKWKNQEQFNESKTIKQFNIAQFHTCAFQMNSNKTNLREWLVKLMRSIIKDRYFFLFPWFLDNTWLRTWSYLYFQETLLTELGITWVGYVHGILYYLLYYHGSYDFLFLSIFLYSLPSFLPSIILFSYLKGPIIKLNVSVFTKKQSKQKMLFAGKKYRVGTI